MFTRKNNNDDLLSGTNLTAADKLFLQQPHITQGASFYNEDIKDRSKRLVVYDKVSCCCLTADTPLRKWLVWLINSPSFDNFIIAIIALNSLQLAAMDYSDRPNESKRN